MVFPTIKGGREPVFAAGPRPGLQLRRHAKVMNADAIGWRAVWRRSPDLPAVDRRGTVPRTGHILEVFSQPASKVLPRPRSGRPNGQDGVEDLRRIAAKFGATLWSEAHYPRARATARHDHTVDVTAGGGTRGRGRSRSSSGDDLGSLRPSEIPVDGAGVGDGVVDLLDEQVFPSTTCRLAPLRWIQGALPTRGRSGTSSLGSGLRRRDRYRAGHDELVFPFP
jgi:hypothetical protein